MTQQEFNSIFAGPQVDSIYQQGDQIFRTKLDEVIKQMKGATFVRLNPGYSGGSGELKAGRAMGPMTLKQNVRAIDNLHVIISIDGKERDLKLDEFIKIGDKWVLMGEPELRPARN
jgi:hypothetical protein